MKIYSKDSLKIGEYGFVRDLHPAFNVSDNIFGHKSSYTRHLYYSLRGSKIKSVFFKEGVLNGRIIKKHNGSIDFIVSDFEGIAYLIKNKTKGTLITDSNLLNGHIIFNINNHLYENVDWVNSIQWDDSKNQNRGPDYPEVVWESEDDPLDMEPREASIETLSSWLEVYESDFFELMAINDDRDMSEKDNSRVNYLKGIIFSLETSIDSIQRGGIEKGIDALARVYLKNAKKTYSKTKDESNTKGYYPSEFYYAAGLVWGFREVIEYITGFPESWQYTFAAESDTATLKKYEKTYGKQGAKVRLKLKNKIMKQNTHGTKSGQWSARKSQKLKADYEKAMEKKGSNPYKSSKKTKSQQNLKDWGKQKWTTKSGKKSSVTGERYLPEKAIKALTDKEYARTTAAKRKAKKAGKQVSKQPKDIAKKVAKYRAEYKTGTKGPCWDGYTYVGPQPYAKGSCVKRAEYTPDHEMGDYSIQDISQSSVVVGDFAKDSLKFSFMEGMR